MAAAVFLLLMAGYMVSFSYDENDALDTAYWMERGEILLLLEFRHLVQRMLPLWLWQSLHAAGFNVSAMLLLNLWDFATAAASLMLLYRVLRLIPVSRAVSFWATFAYGTAHCVWVYTGSGRLYSTSMLLVFGAYYAALQLEHIESPRARWLLVIVSATLTCFACLFWLVHVINAIGVGLLIFSLPAAADWKRRSAHLAAYGAFGIVLTLAISVACLMYVQIPLEGPAIKAWMDAAGTQPVQFDRLSPMKASYGQAHGILVMYELPFMINGLMRDDPHLLRVGSLPWQLGKFIFVWVLLLLVYVYPLAVLWRASARQRILILCLYVPLGINMVFGLGWLGSDAQRFMPSMLSQFALGALAVQNWMEHSRRPRLLASALILCLSFIAADNLFESLLPSQRRYQQLAENIKAIRGQVKPADLLVTFGRDVSITYLTMIRYYAGPQFLTTTNDGATYHWDSPRWQEQFHAHVRAAGQRGGRLFLMDRMAVGLNPARAAWGEVQHPHPTVREFAAWVQREYCVTPRFFVGADQYFEVGPRSSPCPAGALSPAAEARP